ncbi:SDR family NAD(P)-dependent oxidoreductase [Fictibacillus phosphorivorans]|uniref:SDR family NAD(P)-dependent oxidoreductase n=1 Tax=Fictibacillus phosphorivorans TaxID=1221500 RepID=UPI003CE73CDC
MKETQILSKTLEMIGNKEMSSFEGMEIIKMLRDQTQSSKQPVDQELVYVKPEWIPAPASTHIKKKMNAKVTFDSPLLIFDTSDKFKEEFKKESQTKTRVILVKPGEGFASVGDDQFEVRPHSIDDYKQLLTILINENSLPKNFVHLWSKNSFAFDLHSANSQLKEGVYSFYALIRALMALKIKERIAIDYIYGCQGKTQPFYTAVSSFLKTVGLESPNIICKSIGVHNKIDIHDLLKRWIQECSYQDMEVFFQDNKRHIKMLKIIEPQEPLQSSVLKKGGTYLITGGLGKLGFAFSKYIAAEYKGKIILTGRSEETNEIREKMKELKLLGAEVVYLPADISKEEQVKQLILDAKIRFSTINGIIHAAGKIKDSFLLRKNINEMEEVLASKVFGTIWLDKWTKDEPLDFFALFSSVSGVFGNIGQCDYSFANRFMDEFSVLREENRHLGNRNGMTLSINWPLWKDGGMKLEGQEIKGNIFQSLPTEKGIEAWGKCIQLAFPNCMVLYGNKEKIKSFLSSDLYKHKEFAAEKEEEATNSEDLHAKTIDYFKTMFAEILKVPADKLDEYVPIQEYGVDSIAIKQFNLKMENYVPSIAKTLLYEYKTIDELAKYFLDNHCKELNKLLGLNEAGSELLAETKVSHVMKKSDLGLNSQDGIAIIGVSGRYPGADNINELYNNLALKKVLIKEVPSSRWDYKEFYDKNPQNSLKGKIYCKHGGFLDNVDQFDPLFFNITPLEAKVMNPEERLLLQVISSTIENAGYSRESLAGKKIGVYTGVTSMNYPLLGTEKWTTEDRIPINTTMFTLPNRISYFFNFTGPSLAIDTACSSSLTAIHMACESIKSGESEAAIAGGVNLYLHPSKYLSMCHNRIVSTKKSIRLFDKDGDGFIPGEGIGAILLKPLKKAIEDKDNIYGVIKGTGLSHKGNSNGFFLPDPKSQESLITEVLEKSKIHPETVSYVEVQALGSEMTDFIEWTSLNRVYQKYTSKKNYCALGSIKPSIGHLESASGISQVTKVLLQLKNKQILPNNLSDQMNPAINLEASPFYIPTELTEWRRVEDLPRRAAISSFGAGGTEAHLIIEEWEQEKSVQTEAGPELVVLSAKTENQLNQAIVNLSNFIGANVNNPSITLADIAYTLQNGRDLYKERFALIANSKEELLQSLQDYLEGRTSYSFVIKGTAGKPKPSRVTGSVYEYDKENLEVVANQWITGVSINWSTMEKNKTRRRIPLPTYPFEQRSLWLYNKSTKTTEYKSETIEEKNEQVVSRYYDTASDIFEKKGEKEGYLTFAPFPEKIQGFSWLKVFSEPEKYPDFSKMALAKQMELRSVLFRLVSFNNVNSILDIGCGFSTDIIEFARKYPHVSCDGYTISPNQADFGDRRIIEENLESRVRVFCKDSSIDPFPQLYDLIIGFEVTVHIENKQGVFSNIAKHLAKDGKVVLADCIANTVNAVNLSHLGQYTSTQSEYSKILAANKLKVVECVDAGQQIANFLYDPDFKDNLEKLCQERPELNALKQEHMGWNNFGKALEMNLFRYVLLTLEKAGDDVSEESLIKQNKEKLENYSPYEEVANQHQPLHTKRTVTEKNDLVLEESQIIVNEKFVRLTIKNLSRLIDNVLEIGIDHLDVNQRFAEYGVDSLIGLKMLDTINKSLGISLEANIIFDYSSIQDLGRYLAQTYPDIISEKFRISNLSENKRYNKVEKNMESIPKPNEKHNSQEFVNEAGNTNDSNDIAVIGMSGKFPGAENVTEFWNNLKNGIDSVSEIPKDRWNMEEFYNPDPLQTNKTYSKWGGFLNDIDKFDPAFFQISPAEAEVMDPQQRIFLEECWKAIEDAGYPPHSLSRLKCGVFAGVFGNEYSAMVQEHIGNRNAHLMTGNTNSILASRIAYFLNLKGPAISIDTACSSSLVAVHLACKSLQNKEAELMLAGGITLYLTEKPYISMSNAGMLSHEGKCKTFDNSADGIVPAEGAGVVVLKRLDRALEDGDYIYGVIKASEINQDGKTNGITAPSAQSQQELETEVYQKYQINPRTISFVEGHGTGTKLGDPIEISALSNAYKKFTEDKQFCAIGSVKSNLGHTSAASGVISLMKVLLSLKNNQIPPTLHVNKENKHINFADTPFYVNRELKEWESEKNSLRRAAINSFGFSGTNCHMVIEEQPLQNKSRPQYYPEQMFILSARNKERLTEYAQKIIHYLNSKNREEMLEQQRQELLANVCYTLQTGRSFFSERLVVVTSSIEDLIANLSLYIKGEYSQTGLYFGNCNQTQNHFSELLEDEEGTDFIHAVIKNKKYEKLAQLWVSGVEIKWAQMYEHAVPCRIPLPSYPFVRERYWINSTNKKKYEAESASQSRSTQQNQVVVDSGNNDGKAEEDKHRDVYYQTKWSIVPIKHFQRNKENKDNKILIISRGYTTNLENSIESVHNAGTVYRIILGTETTQLNASSWTVKLNDEHAFRHVIERIGKVDTIYYLGAIEKNPASLKGIDTLHVSQEYGIISFFKLIKSLIDSNMLSDLNVKVVTNNVYQVLPDEQNIPNAASLQGFAKSLVKEYTEIDLATLDLSAADLFTEEEEILTILAQAIINEPTNKKADTVALRNGIRYERKLIPLTLPETDEIPFQRNGVYIILGGMGTIGYELAAYLSKHVNARLVLTGRSELDTEKESKLTHLEELGGKAIYLRADLSNLDEVKQAFNKAKVEFGKINGVIHSAMHFYPMNIKDMDESDLRATLDPKVKGSAILQEVLKYESIDFLLFFSSAQAFTSNAARSHYAAAIEFKDSFAAYLNRNETYAVKNINWGFWGLRRGNHFEELNKIIKDQGAFPITKEEGMETICRSLVSETHQVVMLKVKDYVLKLMDVATKAPEIKIEHETHSQAVFSENVRNIEEQVQKSVAECLKVNKQKIDTEIPFMDMGVDSILAGKIVNSINSVLKVTISSADLFENPTIGKLCTFIRNLENTSLESPELKLNNMDEMEDRELYSLLKKLENKEINVNGANEFLGKVN